MKLGILFWLIVSAQLLWANPAGKGRDLRAIVPNASAVSAPIPLSGQELAWANVSNGLSWLSESLGRSMKGNPKPRAEIAARKLAELGATPEQAKIVLGNEIASGRVAPPAESTGFWGKIKGFSTQLKDDFQGFTGLKKNAHDALQEQKALKSLVKNSGSALTKTQSQIDLLTAKAARGEATAQDFSQLKQLQKNLDQASPVQESLNQEVSSSKISKFSKGALQFAVTSAGIRAGVNLVSQAINGEEINVGKAVDFMARPDFWTGTAGSFLGSVLLSSVGSALLPGAGPFLQTLPGFLGAAVGYEIGSGNADRTNWSQILASSAASAAAMALIGGPIGIGVSLLAGVVINQIFADQTPTSQGPVLAAPRYHEFSRQMPLQNTITALPEWAARTESPSINTRQGPLLQEFPATQSLPKTVDSSASSTSFGPPLDPEALKADMQRHYDNYLRLIKAGDGENAKKEHALYQKLNDKLNQRRQQ